MQNPRQPVIRVALLGRRAEEIRKTLSGWNGNYEHVYLTLNVNQETVTSSFSRCPDVVVLCKSDLETELLEYILYCIDLYRTGVLWILPEFSSQILKMFKTTLFDYIVGDPLPFEIVTRIRKLHENKQHYVKYVQTKQAFYVSRRNLLRTLSSLAESKGGLDSGHIFRVKKLAEIIANRIKIPPAEIDMISIAVESHDIGKLGVSDSLLKLDRQLTLDEYEIVKTHTQIGAEIIDSIGLAWGHLGVDGAIVLKYARDISLLHHEYLDGSGYPFGLSKQDIPIYVRIATVVDIYDALRTKRPYKPGWSHGETIDYLEDQLHHKVDQDIVKILKEEVTDEIQYQQE